MSAKNFGQLSGKEQAISLGINTDEYDKVIKTYKEEFTGLNRDLKNIGTVKQAEKVERVSVVDLLADKKVIDDFNNIESAKTTKIVSAQKMIERLQKDYDDLLKELELAKKKIEVAKKQLQELPVSQELKKDDEVLRKIENAEKINSQASDYEKFLENETKISEKKEEIEKNKNLQKQAEENKINYIRAFKFGFDGLTVDEEGSLLLDDGKGARPIREPYYSKGQLEVIVAKLHSSIDPEFKVRWIDDFNLLDKSNQEKIVNELLEGGFQIITSEIATSKEGKENVVLLKDCTVVDSYEEKPKKSLL
jgi:hypothetical protein